MRNSGRKLLVLALVVFYGGISLLGHGLHEFVPAHVHSHYHLRADGYGHTHPHDHDHHCAHGSCSHHHAHAHAPVPEQPGLSDRHDCEICVFLDHVRSQAPPVATAEVAEPLIVDVAPAARRFCAQVAIGIYSPRGPPVRWG